ncbi:hypothetical protein GCM10007424_05370 [Flavobacterium suaedae]|uniref:Carboxypeptidase-like regulatory domain-containing protein n=1 Tax=Flavobacterium suaedae TaxID=1767027 RepID=A0ABQ1JGY6_9FLAO|nr:carboxypeptidase-like regulatory domain-containing protein [Flavobacterium suaedae]GGB68280.1 hypothetical protein GCM10007424_05370 [Flavobacterium suaedae]
MKNFIVTLLFILSTVNGIAQNFIKGVIKDIATNETIERASIYTADFKLHTISNKDGVFKLYYREGNKSFTVKYLGYKDLKITVNNLPADGIYYLEPKNLELEEIVLNNIPINELIESLVESSVKRLEAPVILNTYYREFIRINDTFTKFSDALIDYNFYKNKRETKVKTDLSVKQSRFAELNKVEEGFIRGVGPDVRKAIEIPANFSVIKEVFPNKKEYTKYNFKIASYGTDNGEPLQAITFAPKEDLNELFYEGVIIYSPNNSLIRSIEAKMTEKSKENIRYSNILIAKLGIEDLVIKSGFNYINNQYLPAYYYIYGVLHIWNRNYDKSYKYTSDIIVTNVSEDVSSFSDEKKYKKRSLYENGNNYTSKFWQGNNSLVLTPNEEAIIKQLEHKK